jgi:hypothetical protein
LSINHIVSVNYVATERIILGKSRPTVTMVDSFEKKSEDYKPKQLKPKDVF